MKTIELRRHSMRHIPGKHLTQEGVSLARRVGDGMGNYVKVITSNLPRAYETAIAMGYAVDEKRAEWSTYGDDVEQAIHHCTTFAALAKVARRDPATNRYCELQHSLLVQVVQGLAEGENALIISHGGVLELTCIGCFPHALHRTWGSFFSYCEGARMVYEGEGLTRFELLRVS